MKDFLKIIFELRFHWIIHLMQQRRQFFFSLFQMLIAIDRRLLLFTVNKKIKLLIENGTKRSHYDFKCLAHVFGLYVIYR